jgi:RNA polymerase sigma-70 factor (ECF subfamily)
MDHFATTQWSLVLNAGRGEDTQANDSLARLCQTYWLPIYAYVRRRTRDPSTAQDLTQDFFARLLEKNLLAAAVPERGRFRSFLLVSLKHFLINQHQREQAQKRGGGKQVLALDWDAGESRLSLEPIDHRDPDQLFERQWALTVLEQTLSRLRAEWGDRPLPFDLLQPFLIGDAGEQTYAELSAQLGMTAGAARQTVSRMRKRYRELLREEVAATLDSHEDMDEELQRLFGALAS